MEPCPLLRRLSSGVAVPPTQPPLRAACASLPRYQWELPESPKGLEKQAEVKLTDQAHTTQVVAYRIEVEPDEN